MGSGDDKRSLQSKSPPAAPSSNSKTSRSLNELTRLAHEQLQRGELQKAMEHFECAVEKAKGTSDTNTTISCNLNAGACLVSLRQYKKGLKFLEYALKIMKSTGLYENHPVDGSKKDVHMLEAGADVYYNIAIAAQGMQNYSRAYSCFKASIDLYLRAGSKLHAAEGFSSLSSCHQEAGESEKEITCQMSARQLYHELGDCSSEAAVCVDLAKAYLGRGKKDECRKMLSTAKMLCLRVDESKMQGKLYSQFGLLHTSLGMFDKAIENFERALPLIRKDAQTNSSQQTETSILQNIGAAYNEMGLFSEAIIYHKEAAALHGKTKNTNSESKCLCNLAFAYTQQKDYPQAAKSFSNSLAKAHQAGNIYLQFQSCEGLGSVNYQMGRCGEAVSYFNQALSILNEIKQDSGIARERVMEKLSDASEALQQLKLKQVQKQVERHKSEENNRVSLKLNQATYFDGTPESSFGSQEEGASNQSPVLSSRHLTPAEYSRREGTTQLESGEVLAPKKLNVDEELSLPERRGLGLLPPIDLSGAGSQPLTAQGRDEAMSGGVSDSSKKSQGSRKHAKLVDRGRRNARRNHSLAGSKIKDTNDRIDSYDEELQAYMDSYRDPAVSRSSDAQFDNSTCESNNGTDHKQKLRVNLFSRQATASGTAQQKLKERAGPIGMSNDGTSVPSPTDLDGHVQEGCLAIGPNARELYTIETKVTDDPRKGRHKSKQLTAEIVPKTPLLQNSSDMNQHVAGSHQSSAPGNVGTTSTTNGNQQSKVCIVL